MLDQFKFWKRNTSTLSGKSLTADSVSTTTSGGQNPWDVHDSTKELFSQSTQQNQFSGQSSVNNQFGSPFNDPSISGNPQQFGNYQQNNSTTLPPSGSAAENLYQQSPETNAATTANNAIQQRDVDLILAKLETIKVSLDNLSHRVERIEQKNSKTSW